MTPYRYETNGRNLKTLFWVALVWALILAAVYWLEASLILAGLVALCTLPAIYDLAAERQSGVTLEQSGLHWFAGSRSGEVAWDKFDHIRLDTRLDLSVRASAVLTSGRKLRLPLECTPNADSFADALAARGIRVERHHFSLLG